MADRLKVKPLIPAAVWDFWQRLKLEFPEPEPLFHTQLSAFVNPKKMVGAGGDWILETIVDLVLLARRPDDDESRHAFAVFDIKADDRKANFLRRHGLYYAAIGDDVALDTLRNLCSEPPTSGLLEKATWRGHLDAVGIAAKEIPTECVLHEVALSEFIDITELSNLPDQQRNYLKRARVDAVICTAPPMAIPQFVVEWDGQDHEKPVQRENDRLKDSALGHAGVVGVRVTTEDLPPPKRSRRPPREQKLMEALVNRFAIAATHRQDYSWWHIESVQSALLWKAQSVEDKGLRQDLSALVAKLSPLTKRWADDSKAREELFRKACIEAAELRAPPPEEDFQSDPVWVNDYYEWREEDEAERLADDLERGDVNEGALIEVQRYFDVDQQLSEESGRLYFSCTLKPRGFLELGGCRLQIKGCSPKTRMRPIGTEAGLKELFLDALRESAKSEAFLKLRLRRLDVAAALRRSIAFQRRQREARDREDRRAKYASLTEEACLDMLLGRIDPNVIRETLRLRGGLSYLLRQDMEITDADLRREAEARLNTVLCEIREDIPETFDAHTFEQLIRGEFLRLYGGDAHMGHANGEVR